MKKILLIAFVLVSANLFAQQKDDYFVKNNGDTVYCNIKKIDWDKIKIASKIEGKNIWMADSVKSFLFKGTIWNTYSFLQGNNKKKSVEETNVFFPEVVRSTRFEFGNWGKALGAKNTGSINALTDGRTLLYEVTTTMNQSSWLTGGATISYNSRMFLKNKELGLSNIGFTRKKSSEESDGIIELLREYTKDKSIVAHQLDNNFYTNYENVHTYLLNYITH